MEIEEPIEDGSAFALGADVEAKRSDGAWCPGKIEAVLGGDRYMIAWEDGSSDDRVRRGEHVRHLGSGDQIDIEAKVEQIAVPPRGIVQTDLGGVHFVTTGSRNPKLTPIVAFHMSPRSVDEYKEVMPVLSRHGRLVIAIDEVGYGSSDIPNRSCTLEEIAENALAVLNHLNVQSFIVCGSLMGNFLSMTLASKYPARVKALVMTNCYAYPDDEVQKKKEELAKRAQNAEGGESTQQNDTEKINDGWELREDGSHLTDIWNSRKAWLSAEMNTRATRDNLIYNMKRKERYASGISIQDAPLFEFQAHAEKVDCPCIAINGQDAVAFFDMIGSRFTEQSEKTRKYFKDLVVAEGVPGHINIVNTHAQEWSAEVMQFFEKGGL